MGCKWKIAGNLWKLMEILRLKAMETMMATVWLKQGRWWCKIFQWSNLFWPDYKQCCRGQRMNCLFKKRTSKCSEKDVLFSGTELHWWCQFTLRIAVVKLSFITSIQTWDYYRWCLWPALRRRKKKIFLWIHDINLWQISRYNIIHNGNKETFKNCK